MSSFKDTSAFYLLDTNDRFEYWRYLYEYSPVDRTKTGLIIFLKNFYRDYSIRELAEESMIEITSKLRDRLLAMANKIFIFVDSHDIYIKPYV